MGAITGAPAMLRLIALALIVIAILLLKLLSAAENIQHEIRIAPIPCGQSDNPCQVRIVR